MKVSDSFTTDELMTIVDILSKSDEVILHEKLKNEYERRLSK